MKILGIHDGHDASAAIMVNGEILAAAQEERFTGLKGDYGYPNKAIEYCLNVTKTKSEKLDCIALSSSNLNPVLVHLKRNANFSVSDWVREQEEFWYDLKYNKKTNNYLEIFNEKISEREKYYDYNGIISGYMKFEEMEKFLEIRKKTIKERLGVDDNRILVTNHETNHKCYALFASKFRGEKILILTNEGIGDEYNATVTVYEDGQLHEIINMKECHLGHIYMYVTLILGMKPGQHEYKVMGLAPYSNEYETNKAYTVFKKIQKVVGCEIKFDERPNDLYFSIRDQLKDCRFDGIAGGLQKFLEEIMSEWVKNCIQETGINKVVFAGGVAQNIKAMKVVSELDCVKNLFIPPAAGDTSNCIGSCFQAWYLLNEKNYQKHLSIKPLNHLYLGPEPNKSNIDYNLKIMKKQNYNFQENVTNKDIAGFLAKGYIVGLCRGRMEFGLRSLGNRSILADPSDPGIIDKINQKIKRRDFWMPFTPSIIDRREKDYIMNDKNLEARFMTMAFNSTELAQHDLPAAMHPADKTIRANVVNKHANPEYYELIEEFEKITGRGVLLNTSFNLHGLPVVLGEDEAIYTFENSQIDILILNSIAISRV